MLVKEAHEVLEKWEKMQIYLYILSGEFRRTNIKLSRVKLWLVYHSLRDSGLTRVLLDTTQG